VLSATTKTTSVRNYIETSVSRATNGQVFIAYSGRGLLDININRPTFMVRSDQRSFPFDHLFGRPLRTQIPVVIECHDDARFTARIPELNMAMSGDTAGDARSALKEYVEMSLESFRRERGTLGPEPAGQLRLLETYIGKGWGRQLRP
jgi:hypothetical protein